jgi:HTH-type transcriptional repressor of NAD biosynthesis genes
LQKRALLPSDRVGLVVGKFAPVHRGHQHLIERALGSVDKLVIAVYETPALRLGLDVRVQWLRELYGDAEVLELDDPLYTDDDPDTVSRRYAEHFRGRYQGSITHVFSSEEYGERLARHLGARHVLVDRERSEVPISGTLVRSDPYRYREFLDPLVYRSLVVKVCFAGAESTGKTTLAQACATRLDTVWMPEHGREVWEAKGRSLTADDFVEIARGHVAREDELALNANRFLFCDTNAIATEFWSRFYTGDADPELVRIAEEVQHDYVYVLCRNDFPWFQDGARETDGGRIWHGHQRSIHADLDRRGLDYLEVGGTVEERVQLVARWLEERFPPEFARRATSAEA